MTDPKPLLSLTDRIIAYEEGTLEWNEVISLFQELIDNGMAWTLQGHYGRAAVGMIRAGYCTASTDAAKAYSKR